MADLEEVPMPDRNAFGGFAVGILIGGLAAGVAALLFAPQSGAETRTMIKDKSIELRDKAQERTDEALARIEAIATEARARIEEVAVQLGRQNKNAVAPVEAMAAEKLDSQSAV
jgi:gas vesicle protein